MSDEQPVLYEIKKNFLYPVFPLIAAILVLLLTIVQIEDVFSYVSIDGESSLQYGYSGLIYLGFLIICIILFIWLTVKLTFPFYNLQLTEYELKVNLRAQGNSRLNFNEVINMTHIYSLTNLKFKNIIIPLNEIREIYSVRNKIPQAEIYLFGLFIIIRTDGAWIIYNVKNQTIFQEMHQKFLLAFGDRWQYVFKGSY